jgi:hypothetical protein
MASELELVALQETLHCSSNPTRRWLYCTRRDWIIDALSRSREPARMRALEVGPGSDVYLQELAGTVRRQFSGAGFVVEEQHQSGMYLPLLAKFGGARALRLEQKLERQLRGKPGGALLGTQYYSARAAEYFIPKGPRHATR